MQLFVQTLSRTTFYVSSLWQQDYKQRLGITWLRVMEICFPVSVPFPSMRIYTCNWVSSEVLNSTILKSVISEWRIFSKKKKKKSYSKLCNSSMTLILHSSFPHFSTLFLDRYDIVKFYNENYLVAIFKIFRIFILSARSAA